MKIIFINEFSHQYKKKNCLLYITRIDCVGESIYYAIGR